MDWFNIFVIWMFGSLISVFLSVPVRGGPGEDRTFISEAMVYFCVFWFILIPAILIALIIDLINKWRR